MKKCPPGVLCIENMTFFFVFFFIVCIVLYLIYSQNRAFCKNKNIYTTSSTTFTPLKNSNGTPFEFSTKLPVTIVTDAPLERPITNLQGYKDVLLNPYSPPLSDERYFMRPNSVPINVSTNVGAVDTSYRQVGLLHPLHPPNKNNVLALLGRPIYTNRDKWQYYTIGNQLNNVKLPISVKGKNALNEYGINRLYSGDTVHIEGLNEAYKVTIYENDTIKYLPFL